MIIASGYEWHYNTKVKQSLMHLKKDDETNSNNNDARNHNFTVVKMQLPSAAVVGNGDRGISLVQQTNGNNNNNVGNVMGKSTENFVDAKNTETQTKQQGS